MLEMSKVIRSARSPIAGVVIEANATVKTLPQRINADPYDQGWLVRLRPAWESDARLLVTGGAIPAAVEAYMSLLAESFGEAPP